MTAPELWIVAGPNGAGKTTAVQRAGLAALIRDVPFLNPDDRTLARLRGSGYSGFADAPAEQQAAHFRAAAAEVEIELQRAVAAGGKVGIETVLSTDKYCGLVTAVRARGGNVGLVYVAVASPAICLGRIAERVARGGHGVPTDRVAERWQRSLDRLAWFAVRATAFWVYDNSTTTPDLLPPVAAGRDGRLTHLDDAFPELAVALRAVPGP